VLTPIRFEEVSTSVSEHHDIVVPALQREALHQAACLKVVEALLRRPLASLLAKHLVDVTDLDDAEGRDGRERVAFPAIQLIRALPLAHDLPLGPARQIHMAGVHATCVASLARPFATVARSQSRAWESPRSRWLSCRGSYRSSICPS
jgi:hypothetical protein